MDLARSKLKIEVPRHTSLPGYQLLPKVIFESDAGECVLEQFGVGLDAGTRLSGIDQVPTDSCGNPAICARQEPSILGGFKDRIPARISFAPTWS